MLLEATIDTNINLCKLIGKLLYYVLSLMIQRFIQWLVDLRAMNYWFIIIYTATRPYWQTPVLLMISNGNGSLICGAMDCWFTLPVSTRQFSHNKKTTQPQQESTEQQSTDCCPHSPPKANSTESVSSNEHSEVRHRRPRYFFLL